MEEQFSLNELRHLLRNLHHLAYLETHPRAQEIWRTLPSETEPISPGLRLQRALIEWIGCLKPATELPSWTSEWRRYKILYERYVCRRTLREIEDDLSLGERQVRREHHQALVALAEIVRSRLVAPDLSQPAPASSNPIQAVRRLAPVPRIFGLSRLVTEVVEILGRVNKMPVAVEWHIEPDLAVFADRGILHQLLLKLLQFLLAQQACPTALRLQALTQGNQVRVSISSPLSLNEGEDLGLDLCQSLAQTLHAELTIGHDRRRGCQVDLVLPAGTGSCSVLIIDDDPAAIELFSSYLRGLPYRIIGETSSERALSRAIEVRPDAIVLDVVMPAMDGWEILQRFRLAPELEDVPILACSVLDDEELAAALGAAGFLKKPVFRQQLVTALSKLLPQTNQNT